MNLLPLKIYSVFIAFLLCGAGAYLFFKWQEIAERMVEEKHHREKHDIVTTQDLLIRFQRIAQYKKSNDPNELKLAIIEGDILIEELLRLQGLQGDTLGTLLSEATLRGLGGVDRFWNFHRLRNVLVHDSSYALGVHQGQSALMMLEEGLRSWKVA